MVGEQTINQNSWWEEGGINWHFYICCVYVLVFKKNVHTCLLDAHK